MLARRTFVHITGRKTLAELLPVVTVGEVTQEHVAGTKVALAQRTGFPLPVCRLVLLQDAGVQAVHPAGALVQDLDHHVVFEAVVTHQEFGVLVVGAAAGTFERWHLGKLSH